MKSINVFLVDDHSIVRDGLKSIFNNIDGIDVTGEASNFDELKDRLSQSQPDVILLDISLPEVSGIEIAKILSEEYPAIKIIMLSMYVNDEFIMKAINSGASGYLPKNTSKTELIKAIRAVYDEGHYFTPYISNLILKNVVRQSKPNGNTAANLSNRELEILKMFSEGLSNKEIADKLFISVRTVESHKNHIMQKLELRSPVDMVKYAIKNNIIEI